MTCETSAAVAAVVSKHRRLAGCNGRRCLMSVAGLAGLTFLAGGCGGGTLMELKSSAEFQQQVLHADRPVMVEFFKGGCDLCELLEPVVAQLANDYRGRVVFAEYRLMNFFWIVTNPELKSKYDIGVYPTVILFVNGQEKKRWVMHYDIKSYRKALDEALGVPATQATPPSVVPAPARARVP